MNATPKQKRTRNRKPQKPNFHLPHRGEKCINWLPIAKRELIKRVHNLAHYRIIVLEIIIPKVIASIFNMFNLSQNALKQHPFKLNENNIISHAERIWNEELLSKYNGPIMKSAAWKTKLWEGQNCGYFKLCKNWADQHKYRVSHIFWIEIYQSILQYIHKIADLQYSSSSNLSLYTLFLRCLRYCCLFTTLSSKVGFPKTRPLPLMVNTVIAKNMKLKNYIQQAFEPQLKICQWKEQISETYTTDKKICGGVKKMCIDYIADQMRQSMNEFSRLLQLDTDEIRLNEFVFSHSFDANGILVDKDKKSTKKVHKNTNRVNTNKVNANEVNTDEVSNETDYIPMRAHNLTVPNNTQNNDEMDVIHHDFAADSIIDPTYSNNNNNYNMDTNHNNLSYDARDNNTANVTPRHMHVPPANHPYHPQMMDSNYYCDHMQVHTAYAPTHGSSQSVSQYRSNTMHDHYIHYNDPVVMQIYQENRMLLQQINECKALLDCYSIRPQMQPMTPPIACTQSISNVTATAHDYLEPVNINDNDDNNSYGYNASRLFP